MVTRRELGNNRACRYASSPARSGRDARPCGTPPKDVSVRRRSQSSPLDRAQAGGVEAGGREIGVKMVALRHVEVESSSIKASSALAHCPSWTWIAMDDAGRERLNDLERRLETSLPCYVDPSGACPYERQAEDRDDDDAADRLAGRGRRRFHDLECAGRKASSSALRGMASLVTCP